jgi:hypothetical protein
VRNIDEDIPVSNSPGDRLFHFAYAVSHIFRSLVGTARFDYQLRDCMNALRQDKHQWLRRKASRLKNRARLLWSFLAHCHVLVTGLFIITFIVQAFEIPPVHGERC